MDARFVLREAEYVQIRPRQAFPTIFRLERSFGPKVNFYAPCGVNLYINRSLFTVVDKSFIMSISKNNTDLSSYVINWNSGESGGIARPGGTILGAWVRGGANTLPCAQSQSRSLCHVSLSLSLRHVGVAVLTLRVVSWVRAW